MFVLNLMLRDVPVIPPHTSLREAAVWMEQSRHSLLVVADAQRVHGLMTPRQLVLGAEAEAQGHLRFTAGDVASTRFIFTREGEDLETLAGNMVQAGVRRAVVVDGDPQVRGVITVRELARGPSRRRRSRCVDVASEASFPASDPPSWTATIAG